MKLIISRNVAVLLCMPMVSMAALGGPRNEEEKDSRNLFDFRERMNRRRNRFPNRPRPDQDTTCSKNNDCAEGFYCAAGQCLEMGTCETEWDCRNPGNIYPIIECTGPITCNGQKQCGRICGPTCSDGTFGVQCDMEPCSMAAETCSGSFSSCENDFCGGCNALVFDDAGNHALCPSSWISPQPPNVTDSTSFCSSTGDCGEFEYCLEGVCTEAGKCRSDADCFNPENMYPIIECLGPISCDADTNQCGRECSESNCPADKPPVQCLVAPCDVITSSCNESFVSCVDYYCGGCDAFLFDDAGYQVCSEESTGNLTSPSDGVGQTCNSSNDCADEEYCAGGICLPDGDCNTDIDCKNPENIFASILCVGVTGCFEGGKCGVECGPSSCPEGQEEAECLVAPCDNPPECEEDWEYCVDSNCDGCKAILLDAAGNEVTCTPL